MARLVLSPVPSHWLVVVLLLLSAGEMVPAKDADRKVSNFPAHSVAPAGSACSRIWQHPRFIAKKRGSVVTITCYLKCQGNVTWIWKPKDLDSKVLKPEEGRILQSQSHSNATLVIKGIQPQDNGVYFCQQQHLDGPCEEACDSKPWSCGTELQVTGFSTLAQFKRRNTLKDGIIMIQTMLIIIFIIVPIFLLLEKDDGKAGTEEDHTYEGLNIDQTATYEDIVTLRTGEVKWSVGEHPGQE